MKVDVGSRQEVKEKEEKKNKITNLSSVQGCPSVQVIRKGYLVALRIIRSINELGLDKKKKRNTGVRMVNNTVGKKPKVKSTPRRLP